MKKKTWIILGGVLVLIVVLFFTIRGVRQARTAAENAYQTVKIERGNLTAIVGGTGNVTANQSAILAWQTTGKIGSIYAALDQMVPAGFVLATLDETSLPQSIILAESDLVTARRALDQATNSNLAQAQAQLALVQAQKAYEDARDRRDWKDGARASDDTIDKARAQVVLAKDAVDRAEDLYDRFENRDDDDPLKANALSQLATARLAYTQAKQNIEYLEGKSDAEEIAEADANLALALARYEDAQREWERLKDGADPDDIAAARARVAAVEATLALKRLEAPFAGTITDIRSKPGDQATPGTVSFRVDDLSHLLVEVFIPEIDINRIHVDQPASITFDAIPATEYSGKITEVGRIGESATGVVNFRVTVEITNPDEQVKPGMTAAVNIVVKQLTDVLLVPNRAVRLREGARVVYILKNGIPQAVNIELGSSSDTVSEIVGGDVKAGDVIVLNPPSDLMNAQPPFMR